MSRRWAGAATAAALIAGSLIAVTAAPAQARVAPVPEDLAVEALPTVQVESPTWTDKDGRKRLAGVVWDQAILGSRVYAVGEFQNARPAGAERGQQLTPRVNVLSYDLHTGELIESFVANTNGGSVHAVTPSPDGSRIYIGGTFTAVNGVPCKNVAALDPLTGEVLPWNPVLQGSSVKSIVVEGDIVYMGGQIDWINGYRPEHRRYGLAAATASGEATTWAPKVSGGIVETMVVAPAKDRIVVGGRFNAVNGATQHGMASVGITDGTLLPWAASAEIKNGGYPGRNSKGEAYADKGGIKGLSTDGTYVYGTGWGFAGLSAADFEGAFSADPATGAINWIEDCKGDTYGTYSNGRYVYTAGHAHDCSTLGGFSEGRVPNGDANVDALAFTTERTGTLGHIVRPQDGYKDRFGKPAPDMYGWYPKFVVGSATGMDQAGWDVTGNDDYVVYGGEFLAVDGKTQQGIVRFARPGFTPVTELTADFTTSSRHADLTVDGKRSATVGGAVLTSYSWDFGDGNVAEGVSASHRYAAGGTYAVTLTVTDSAGATARTTRSVEVAGPPHPYVAEVEKDGVSNHWRLGESKGSTLADSVGNLPMTSGPAAFGGTGAIEGETDTSVAFTGAATSFGSTRSAVAAPQTFSVEAWFKTTSTRGGKIVGFENKTDLGSNQFDRMIWLNPDGTAYFGVFDNAGSAKKVTSKAKLNDGGWHHAVGTYADGRIEFYVDGERVGEQSGVSAVQSYLGYWHIAGGAGSPQFWGASPDRTVKAEIDEVAVYPSALSSEQIANHWAAAHDPELIAPTAQFSLDTAGRAIDADASASSASGSKTIVSHEWDLGDGTLAQGPTLHHEYADDGTYTVTLTVVDSNGQTSTSATTITISAYGDLVASDGASNHWRLGESKGSTLADSVGDLPMRSSAMVLGGAGAITGDANTSAAFDGGVPSVATTNTAIAAPRTFSVEAWFKTTTTRGGKIVGFESSKDLSSKTYDRLISMAPDGTVYFGVYNSQVGAKKVTTDTRLNDGEWHHVVGTLGPRGMAFYVDGSLVGENAQLSSGQSYDGYWHIAGGTTGSVWGPAQNWNVQAEIDEVAVYPTALAPEQVAGHWAAAHDPELVAPTAVFEPVVDGRTVAMDASASIASGTKTIVSYAWDLGDGQRADGPVANHAYGLGGTYTVALTVTDSNGQSTTTSREVTVVGDYEAAVRGDGASNHWRLDESKGSTLADSVGNLPMTSNSMRLGTPGIQTGDLANTGASFNGDVASLATTGTRTAAPDQVSVEAWFATTTPFGGKVVGFENSQNLGSSQFDRHLWLNPDGTVYFGAWSNANGANKITSPTRLNDGQWHHVVGVLGPDTIALYVDGALVGEQPISSVPSFQGYWHIGGGSTASQWGTSKYWCVVADIDEVAIYPGALTAEQIQRHHAIGVGR